MGPTITLRRMRRGAARRTIGDVEPVKYVERLAHRYGKMGFPAYEWTINTEAPLTPLRRPLAECRVAMLTSGGVSRCAAPAWDPDARNDFRLDVIEADAPADDFQVHDSYYETDSAVEDINCVFPIERLREFAAEGLIGSVVDRQWSGFMGRIYNRSKVLTESGPAFAAALAEDDVDLLIAVPA